MNRNFFLTCFITIFQLEPDALASPRMAPLPLAMTTCPTVARTTFPHLEWSTSRQSSRRCWPSCWRPRRTSTASSQRTSWSSTNRLVKWLVSCTSSWIILPEDWSCLQASPSILKAVGLFFNRVIPTYKLVYFTSMLVHLQVGSYFISRSLFFTSRSSHFTSTISWSILRVEAFQSILQVAFNINQQVSH